MTWRRSASGRGTSRRRRWLPWVGVAVALIALRTLVAEPFVIPSESMEPGLRPGDRVLVLKLGADPIGRGDVVVFDGSTTFGAVPTTDGVLDAVLARLGSALSGRDGSATYVKRVLAVGGDEITCCTAGAVRVNGRPVPEPYLFPGDAASDQPFHPEQIPPGRLWLMGDHRSASRDSRSHLSANGGGTVAQTDVIGPVVFRLWPLDRFGPVDDASDARVESDGNRSGPP